jgi:hypothetical protein
VTEVINPATGELMDRLDQAPTETLAEVYGAVRAQQVRLEDMRRALKGELQNRLEVRGVARMTVGAYEVGESHGWRSKWDGQQLEAVVRDLLDAGVITTRDVADLIRHEAVVNGHAANSLSRRLVGAHKAAVEDCRTREPERRAFDVVRSLPLTNAIEEEQSDELR